MSELFNIDKRWSFRLGNGFFDEDIFRENMEVIEYLCSFGQKNNFRYVFTGNFALALNYKYCYRNFKDIDLIIERENYLKWINMLIENGWNYISHQEELSSLSLESAIKNSLKDQEIFISNLNNICHSSEEAKKYTIENLKFPPSMSLDGLIIHDPSKNIVISNDKFKICVKGPHSKLHTSYYGFLYYTKDRSIEPHGEHGIPSVDTKFLKLNFKSFDNEFIYWETDLLDLGLLKGFFSYKISIWHGYIFKFRKDNYVSTIDLIIDSPDRLDNSNINSVDFKNAKIVYSMPKYIWEKKTQYSRKKDLNDSKYFKEIVNTYKIK